MTAVNVSLKDQLTLSISVAVGSALVSPSSFPHDAFQQSLFKIFVKANGPVCDSVSVVMAEPYFCHWINRLLRFMVTLAWIMGKPLSLLTDPFESLVSVVL